MAHSSTSDDASQVRQSLFEEMLAGILHDLAQPLSAISNYAAACQTTLKQSAQQPSAQLDADQRQLIENWLGQISVASDRASELAICLRSSLRSHHGTTSRFDLRTHIGETLGLIEPVLAREDWEVHWTPPESSITVQGASSLLQRLWMLLIAACCQSQQRQQSTESPVAKHLLIQVDSTGSSHQIRLATSDVAPGNDFDLVEDADRVEDHHLAKDLANESAGDLPAMAGDEESDLPTLYEYQQAEQLIARLDGSLSVSRSMPQRQVICITLPASFDR